MNRQTIGWQQYCNIWPMINDKAINPLVEVGRWKRHSVIRTRKITIASKNVFSEAFSSNLSSSSSDRSGRSTPDGSSGNSCWSLRWRNADCIMLLCTRWVSLTSSRTVKMRSSMPVIWRPGHNICSALLIVNCSFWVPCHSRYRRVKLLQKRIEQPKLNPANVRLSVFVLNLHVIEY